MSENQEVASPCIGVCSMNEATGYCAGCFRTIEEIQAWWDMSDQQRKDLLGQLDDRQNATLNFDD